MISLDDRYDDFTQKSCIIPFVEKVSSHILAQIVSNWKVPLLNDASSLSE
jgi:hypothetical protein